MEFTKYYGNGIATVLGAIGYLSIPGSYFFKPLIVFSPFIILFFWAAFISPLYALAQGLYGAFNIFYSKNNNTNNMHHLKGVLLSIFGYIIFFVGISFGLIIAV